MLPEKKLQVGTSVKEMNWVSVNNDFNVVW